jgi:hypothetical protein
MRLDRLIRTKILLRPNPAERERDLLGLGVVQALSRSGNCPQRIDPKCYRLSEVSLAGCRVNLFALRCART